MGIGQLSGDTQQLRKKPLAPKSDEQIGVLEQITKAQQWIADALSEVVYTASVADASVVSLRLQLVSVGLQELRLVVKAYRLLLGRRGTCRQGR